jgi:long-chain acyl-CoA synthetase
MLKTLGEIPAYAAHKYGDRIALVTGGRELTFRDIDVLSATLAANLVKLGIAPGDRVTLYAPNSWEWIVSYYGTLRAGAIINPVNVMLTPSEVAYVTKDCGAKALIGSPEKIAPAIAAGVSGLNTIVFGTEAVGEATSFDELVEKQLPFETVKVEANATSAIGYTSGTTGLRSAQARIHWRRAPVLRSAHCRHARL